MNRSSHGHHDPAEQQETTESLRKERSEKGKSRIKQLSEREEIFQKKLSDSAITSTEELSTLREMTEESTAVG